MYSGSPGEEEESNCDSQEYMDPKEVIVISDSNIDWVSYK